MALAQKLREGGLVVRNAQVAPGTLHAVVDGVRVSFLHYTYPLIGELAQPEGESFTLASLDDLACMKLAAVAQRGSRKDYVDVYALATRHKSLREMLELYQRKYSTDDVLHVLIGLTYFDDADEQPMPRMIWGVSWDEVKRNVSDWVKGIADV